MKEKHKSARTDTKSALPLRGEKRAAVRGWWVPQTQVGPQYSRDRGEGGGPLSFCGWDALLTTPGENTEMLVLTFVCICYLLRFVYARAHMHTLQCECGGQRTTLWDWLPLSNFVGIPGSKLRPPGLHEPAPSPAEPP